MATMRRWVYNFGHGKADGRGDQEALLGGKGAGLAEMTRIGLPVPCGFTITTEACAQYNERNGRWPTGLEKEVRQALARLERASKKKLGGTKDPLLVSVRSGAASSMPGMMNTILNLGLNDRSVEGLAIVSSKRRSPLEGNRRFAFDSYRRFIMMYGSTAKHIHSDRFERAFEEVKNTYTRPRLGRGPDERIVDTDVSAEELVHLVGEFKHIYRDATGEDFPQDPFEQLKGAINAVFNSWMSDKAVTFRRVEKITGLSGTAVNVCRMIFGNIDDDCATGVCFTRDPSTGEPTYYGDALINAQGEDVVAGIRTPLKLDELKTRMPEVYDQLEAVRIMLEIHYKDMQDLEFTVERGKLYMLQCRVGKRSPAAAFKIAVDQATKGLTSAATAKRLVKKGYLPKPYAAAGTQPVISKEEAIGRVEPVDIERLFYPILDPKISPDELERRRLGEGIGAVPGAACGVVVFTAEDAEARAENGASVILVRKETSPEDVGGMHVASGILTAAGGKTSHAAVVARGWGKCCIVGCDTLRIDYDAKTMTLNGRTKREGDSLTLNGTAGAIFEGSIDLIRPDAPPEFRTLMDWCDKRRRLKVRANADTPADAAKAIELGADGIGLCRTEHMFFDPSQPQRIIAMREMILADGEAARRRALAKLLPYQLNDFEGIFTAMGGKPVTVRLLDPPLHEFLPQHDNPAGQAAVADELVADIPHEHMAVEKWNAEDDERLRIQREEVRRDEVLAEIRRRVDQLHEVNPMLGHRGCRLCITYPEILEMQVRAIMEAAVNCAARGIKVFPEIMVPLSIDPNELAILTHRIRVIADAILEDKKAKINYLVGTMVETPRAALLAARMAESAEFFSFGTNDLTQMTMGLSRDDAGRFLDDYLSCSSETRPELGRTESGARMEAPDARKRPILAHDPFQSLDVEGVGMLVDMACANGRATRPKLKLGLCGEHGGDGRSIQFCEKVGLDYVSCSPFRVPIARLAAAKAAIDAPGAAPRILQAPSKPRSTVGPDKRKAASTRKTAGKSGSKKKRKKPPRI